MFQHPCLDIENYVLNNVAAMVTYSFHFANQQNQFQSTRNLVWVILQYFTKPAESQFVDVVHFSITGQYLAGRCCIFSIDGA